MQGTTPSTLKIPGQNPLAQTASSRLSGLLSKNSGTGRVGGTKAIPGVSKVKAPSNSAPKTYSPTTIKPVATKAPSNYGYSTTDKTPFNPFAGPKTTGQFNQQVLDSASTQYQPQLDQIQGNVGAENASAAQRNTDLSGIYDKYGAQAKQAFQDTQSAINDLIAQTHTGDASSQANLLAALQSTQGSTPTSVGGVTGANVPSINPGDYAGAASKQSALGEQELSKIAAGVLGQAGNQQANAGLERAQQFDTESQRHGAALQGLPNQTNEIQSQVPGYIEKARETLLANAQNAKSLSFQQDLAGKQFDLSAKTQAANVANQKAQLGQNQQQLNEKAATDAAQLGLDTQKLELQKTQIAAQLSAGKYSNTQQKLIAQRLDNASTLIDNFLKPTPYEVTKTKIIDPNDPNGQNKIDAQQINPNLYHRSAETLYKQLTLRGGLDRNTALRLMTSVDTAQGPGQPTIATWANDKLHPAPQVFTPVPRTSDVGQILAKLK